MTWKEISFKDKFGFVMSICCLTIGTILCFVGLLLPPPGIIDSSVLMGAGEFLSLCAVYSGLTTYTSVFTKKIDSKINQIVNNKND